MKIEDYNPQSIAKSGKRLTCAAIGAMIIYWVFLAISAKWQKYRVEQQVESGIAAAPSVVHVPAGVWFDVYPDPHGKMTILPIESDITCTFRVNDNPREWTTRNGRPVDLSAENPGVTIWKVRVKPDKDATFLTKR